MPQVHSTELYTNKALTYIADMAGNDKPWFTYLAYQVSYYIILGHTSYRTVRGIYKFGLVGHLCRTINSAQNN